MANDENGTSLLILTTESLEGPIKKPDIPKLFVADNRVKKQLAKIDSTTETQLVVASDGVIYAPESTFSIYFATDKAGGAFIFDNQIPDASKIVVDGIEYAHSSEVVGLLDRKSQEVRDTDKSAKLGYSRDSLINAGQSHHAEAVRRQLDCLTTKSLPKLGTMRGGDVDEITGEPLRAGSEFHHTLHKNLHTNPFDAIDPAKGLRLNKETHKEVHRQKIMTNAELEEFRRKLQVARVTEDKDE